MPTNRILKKLLGVENVIIKTSEYSELTDEIVVSARPRRSDICRCGKCGKKSPVYDRGSVDRRWRAPDIGSTKVFVAFSTLRVDCPQCGVTVAYVPWARHGSSFCRNFEDMCCWMSTNSSKTCVSEFFRIDWHTVGSICKRVYDERKDQAPDPFAKLINIGVDETSYKKGHKYMTVVVDHDTGRVVWCADGHGKKVLDSFLGQLAPTQRSSIKCVTADGARWIRSSVENHCPQAKLCIDPFHVVGWATDALDEIRKQTWREAQRQAKGEVRRKRGRPGKDEVVNPLKKQAESVKGSRFSLLKNPENLTERQQVTLDCVQKENRRLYRAYRLKEGLREIFRLPAKKVASQLDRWLSWAQRSRISEFVDLGRKIRRHYDSILATTSRGLSNARVEAINNKIKLTVKMAYGFRNIDNLLAMVMLRCSNVTVMLPGR